MPRVWTRDEVVQMIAQELEEVRRDFRDRRVPFTSEEAAECVYAKLAENFLIELEP